MRRFASVFASKRDKGSPQPLARAHTLAAPTHPPPLPDPAHSSASSSSGSASLYPHTPEDDHYQIPIAPPARSPSAKRSWKSWLRPASLKHSQKLSQTDWAPPPPQTLPDDSDEHDNDDDDDSNLSDEDSLVHPQEPPSPARARNNLVVLVKNSLVHPLSPPPFALPSNASYIFPRSSNPSRILPRSPTLISTMFKSHLLSRLEHPSSPISDSERLSITPLASRLVSPTLPVPPPPIDIHALSNTTLVSPSSRGLRRWISRPCFEDRYAIFTPTPDGFSRQHVTGGPVAVAALEYSEGIDAMVDFDADDTPPLPSPSGPETTPPSPPSQPTAPAPLRNSPYIAVPSPLRNQHNPPPIVLSQSAPPAPSALSTPPTPAAPAAPTEPPVKRGVRFTEDDKDDVIPLGYALRMKKRREEKAKFLRAENERRALAEERAKMDEERRRRDAERAEWERERKAWENEKKAMEEEKKQRLYAEEVAATRLRREMQRAGGVPSSNNNSPAANAQYFPTSPSSTSLRDSERNRNATNRDSRRYSRPVYDSALAPPTMPRRETSDLNLPRHSSLPSSSPESSRPPSVGGGHSTPSPIASGSGTRPPSVYSSQDISSSEDVRQQRAAAAAAIMMNSKKKRNSIASIAGPSSHHSNNDRATSYPMWNNQAMGYIPPVPQIPTMMPAFVMMDMPLLPPTPPFMLQQYPRQHSHGQGSPGPSSNSSSRGKLSSSVNSSRERVNLQQSQNQHPPRSASFPHRPEYRQAVSSPVSGSGSGSAYRPTHERKASGDSSRRASMPVPQPQYMHPRPRQYSQQTPDNRSPQPQPSSMSRGTSQQLLQSPWTGLPSQSGRPPSGMPSQTTPHKSGRRKQTGNS